MLHATKKEIMCATKKTFPLPLNLGKFFWEALGRSLLATSQMGPIELPQGITIGIGRINGTGWKVIAIGAKNPCKVRVLHNLGLCVWNIGGVEEKLCLQ